MIKHKITPRNAIIQMIKEQQNKKIFTGSCDCSSHLLLVLHLVMASTLSIGRE